MKKLEPYPIATALFFIFTILYIVCIGIKYLLIQFGVDGFWQMHKIWLVLLPGFTGINSLSVLIGLLEVSIGAYAIGFILVQTYNFLIKKKIKDIKIEAKPLLLRFKTLFISLTIYTFILFTICFIYDLFVPEELSMAFLWTIFLPGFKDLTFTSYLIGLGDIVLYSAYTSFIFSKTLNYFEKVKMVKVVK